MAKASSDKSSNKMTASKSKKPSHPSSANMVNAAILNLEERSGSSLYSIKKYIADSYDVDIKKQGPFINKYIRSAVASGMLIQTTGKGASGSFKLPSDKTKVKRQNDGKMKKAASPKSPKVLAEKRASKIIVKPPKAKTSSQSKVKSPLTTKVPIAAASKSKKTASAKK